MSQIIDIAGKPANPGDLAEKIAEFERDLNGLLAKYNNSGLSPAAACGVLFWTSMNIFQATAAQALMQQQSLMSKMREAAGKIPVQ